MLWQHSGESNACDLIVALLFTIDGGSSIINPSLLSAINLTVLKNNITAK
jgi:hypothetical protein